MIWSPAERAAWTPPQKLLPDQWVDRYGYIPDNGINPEPGPCDLSRTPYLREPLNAAVDKTIEEIVFLKCTQVGFSTYLRLILSYWIDADPGPCLVLLPDELSAKEWLDEDVVPTLEQAPRLQRYRRTAKKDNKTTAIRLASMWIFAAWAGSAQRLARRPIRYFVGDETDKYPEFTGKGKESSPIQLGLKRLSNWKKRAKAFFGSTPTTRAGPIWLRWEACADKRHYHVPCPHCGEYQILVWPQVRGWTEEHEARAKTADGRRAPRSAEDKVALANRIKVDELAYYECAHCRGAILDAHKSDMLLRGVWASETQTVAKDGTLIGERPRSVKVGFHLSSLYSPWLDFSTLAAEWVLAEGDVALTMDFWNSRLGMPFDQQVAKTRASFIKQKSVGAPPPLIVPKWARLIIATADTQGDDAKTGWFPFVVRAWTYGLRSQLIDHGIANTFAELRLKVLDRYYPVEPGGMARQMAPLAMLIDTGGRRWSEVYEFAQSDPARIMPCKGASKSLEMPVMRSHLIHRNVVLWKLDPNQNKDMLNRLIHDEDPGKWLVNTGIGDSYCNELAAQHKILHPKTKKAIWTPTSQGVADHFHDCEAMQCAAAFEFGAVLPEPAAAQPTARDREDEVVDPLNSWRGKW